MKLLGFAAAALVCSASATLAHDSLSNGNATSTHGFHVVYEIISITPRPELAGYQELNLNPAPSYTPAQGAGTYPGGEAVIIYPHGG
ncbi:MAG: hypothetical protein ACWA47_11420 [Brevirhabdus sp.]